LRKIKAKKREKGRKQSGIPSLSLRNSNYGKDARGKTNKRRSPASAGPEPGNSGGYQLFLLEYHDSEQGDEVYRKLKYGERQDIPERGEVSLGDIVRGREKNGTPEKRSQVSQGVFPPFPESPVRNIANQGSHPEKNNPNTEKSRGRSLHRELICSFKRRPDKESDNYGSDVDKGQGGPVEKHSDDRHGISPSGKWSLSMDSGQRKYEDKIRELPQ
jgi:hypothetical protein